MARSGIESQAGSSRQQAGTGHILTALGDKHPARNTVFSDFRAPRAVWHSSVLLLTQRGSAHPPSATGHCLSTSRGRAPSSHDPHREHSGSEHLPCPHPHCLCAVAPLFISEPSEPLLLRHTETETRKLLSVFCHQQGRGP